MPDANSAPCRNEKGRKNARNDVVGKPGRCVAARSPFELTAISMSGNVSGGIHVPGCLNVRTIDRRAISQICRLTGSRSGVGEADASALCEAPSSLRLVFGAFERPARLREEDVVQRRLVQVDLRGTEVLAVERADDFG